MFEENMKKVLFCLIIGVLISNVYAEKSKLVKHLKFNEPLKYYTYWDPNEGISPGIDILIAKNDNDFYGFCYNSNTWYHFVQNEYEELIKHTCIPGSSENGQPIYFYDNNTLVIGIINYGSGCNNLHLHINKNGNIYDINERLNQYTYIQSESSLFFSDDVLFLLTYDRDFVIIELKPNQSYNITDINDSKKWIMENTKKYGINYIDGIMFFGDYTFLPSSKKYYLNDDTINILNKNYGQINSIEELGYKPIGKDSVGLDYFRLLKYDGVNIKYSIAVYNSWSNEIIIYDDFEKNDWNPPKKDDIDDDELEFVGAYPWTIGADGAIYFLDADDKEREYQIKKIENRWYKDFGIDKKQIGHCNSNDIPLYTEKNVTSKTEVFNYCNDCLLILKKEGEFCKVRKIDGREGWMETKYITFADAEKTNVAVNKEMTCSDNLRLRSEEATSSKIITTMAKGTKVKILKLGKAEIVDGINSNWVQVEILSGAKDKDGEAIKPGTIGWCYGGYLE